MTPVFLQKAEELRDRWDEMLPEVIMKDPSSSSVEGSTSIVSNNTNAPAIENVLDVAHWISRATFDAIGLAGFDYNFNSLEDETEEVYLAYRKMFNVADKGPGFKGLLRIYFPMIERLLVSAVHETLVCDQYL